MRRLPVLLLLAVALGIAPAASSAPPGSVERDPAYSVPRSELVQAVSCPGGFPHGRPVLLVHGTGSTGEESWTRTYVKALPHAGFDPCFVTMPGRTLGDAQVSAEYVAFAVRHVHQLSGRRVAVIGHSQGTLNARWALRFWSSARALVTDYVSIAGDHHGASGAEHLCSSGSCVPSLWQQRPTSRFLEALNRGSEVPPGVSTTSIYTLTDEVVQPQADGPGGTSWLRGASNVALQAVCPGRYAGHVSLVTDAVAYAVVVDALRHPGPAVTARLPATVCAGTTAPGMAADDVAWANAYAYGQALIAVNTGEQVDSEPELKPYAR